MLPSQTAALDKLHVKGFATDVGGRTSHTAIVACAMGIPAVVGLGDITAEIGGEDVVIIDGNRGAIIINPDADQIAEHRELEKKQIRLETELRMRAHLRAATLDGRWVSLWAHIQLPEDVNPSVARGAGGIGLYCTVLSYLAAPAGYEVTQEEHFTSYADALKRL